MNPQVNWNHLKNQGITFHCAFIIMHYELTNVLILNEKTVSNRAEQFPLKRLPYEIGRRRGRIGAANSRAQ